ncbi:FtsQ-type POTRA domain-containing protein [Sporosarcina sp. GW1-11]|uniref:cell division protein FtsQ/DivIB n=1 Tax=Sporosarcina sp. GW1-11 TaxID=2899126 RepID=UPI00294DBF90|nr:cell division protein FtsQ/DivIB [Sporosarcina sp. GW1-11]MDV6376797.1 FtsQ-type POTRA domain-containing protein [Sporosarcina sp. GW1-11]
MDKVIDIEDRIPSLRKKRKRKANKKFLLLVAIFLLVLLALLYFQSPLSDVQDISINNTTLNDSESYKNQSGLYTGQSFWGFRTRDIERNLMNITGVKEVSVSRKYWNDVSIEVTEWKPVAYIENKTQYDLLLENGERMETKDTEALLHAPILSRFTEPEAIERMIQQLQEMDNSVFELISELRYKGDDKIEAFMNDGYEVHAPILGFADKMSYYPDIIAQLPKEEKGILDMEIGVYFKTYTDYYKEPEQQPLEEAGPGGKPVELEGKKIEIEMGQEGESEQESEGN